MWVCAGVCCGFVGVFRAIAMFSFHVKPLSSPKILVSQKVFLHTSSHFPTLGGAQNSQIYHRHTGMAFCKHISSRIIYDRYMIDTKATSARYSPHVEDVGRNGGLAPSALKPSSILR